MDKINKDPIEKLEDRILKLYSNGGKIERSFYNNIGKIYNKKAIFFRGTNSFDEVMERCGDYLYGKHRDEDNQ
jgi:hypothetical protein